MNAPEAVELVTTILTLAGLVYLLIALMAARSFYREPAVTLIGDPLYRPFAANPQVKAEDLPPYIRAELEKVIAGGVGGR